MPSRGFSKRSLDEKYGAPSEGQTHFSVVNVLATPRYPKMGSCVELSQTRCEEKQYIKDKNSVYESKKRLKLA